MGLGGSYVRPWMGHRAMLRSILQVVRRVEQVGFSTGVGGSIEPPKTGGGGGGSIDRTVNQLLRTLALKMSNFFFQH